MFKTDVEKLIANLGKIPDEFWVRSESGHQVIWIIDQADGTAGSYESSEERIGITKNGDILWGFASGCSCWDGWQSKDYCPTKSWKEFNVEEDFLKQRSSNANGLDIESNLKDFLLLVEENPDPKDVLGAKNAEIRRYLIKRVGYENIKDSVKAVVLHRDGDNELLKFANEEMYVKVKDSSTDRDYLLFVEGNHKTCRSAIAWTFGLKEEEYCPLIET